MQAFNVIATTTEDTVVAQYEPAKKRSDSYQSEAALEREFIQLLTQQGYAYLPIHQEADLIANLRRQLEESRREAEALREQVARLEPDAAAYAAVKDRSAGVELEAHRRAQGVLDQANSQARHLRQQMEQWMTRVGREYDALRTEVEATISHAVDQLDKAGKCLEQVSALLSDQDVALEELSRAYDSTAPDKVPAPVPLEEEP